MKNAAQTLSNIDRWIPQEELPVRPGLKVIRKNDPDYGLTEGEIQNRNEFIRCYLFKDFEILVMIPKQSEKDDFFIPDCDVFSDEYSAFNTYDFQKTLRPFDKYAYAMKKIMERIKDLAILHSVISSQERRTAAYRRYESLVELEFRSRLMYLVEQYKKTKDEERKLAVKKKIGEVNRRILEARKVWEQHAPWDT